jgi:hypothetical protein
MTKLSQIGAVASSAVLLFITARTAAGAIYGFTTWEQGGQTNTIQSGDLISLSFVQGTQTNIYGDSIDFQIGTSNNLANNLVLIDSSYYNLPDGTVTNGFYNGKVFEMSYGYLLYQAFTNRGLRVEGYMVLNNSSTATSGTGSVATATFQAYNPGPTNLVVRLQLTNVQVSKPGGNYWAFPATWARTSPDYGNSSYTYVRILAPASPQVAGVTRDDGSSTVSLTVNLDPGTSNVVLYCTELGGGETPVTNIVISLDAPDKVTTNITGLPAPGPKGFWWIKSIR